MSDYDRFLESARSRGGLGAFRASFFRANRKIAARALFLRMRLYRSLVILGTDIKFRLRCYEICAYQWPASGRPFCSLS